eukprot:COSAG02_NODE_11924_length_1630_cov_1.372959_1_plen_520_part_01
MQHHEGGFCLWPSNFSNYTVRESPYKGGRGDVVREFVQSCKKYDMQPCFYWGPNANGDLLQKGFDAETFVNLQLGQLRELLTQYGPISRLWWDHYLGGCGLHAPCPAGSFPAAWPRFVELVRTVAPDTLLCPGPDCHGHITEDGRGAYPLWYNIRHGSTNVGEFMPKEVCATPYPHAWFAKGTGAGQDAWTIQYYWYIYMSSVGIGYVNTVNAAPGTTGQVPEDTVAKQRAFGEVLTKFEQPVKAATNQELSTPMNCSAAQWTIHLDPDAHLFDAVRLREDLSHEQRILQYTLEYLPAEGPTSSWLELPRLGESTTTETLTTTIRDPEFTTVNNSNNIGPGSRCFSPSPNRSSADVTYAGTVRTWELCKAACLREPSCHSATWVSVAGHAYGHNCMLRNDSGWCPQDEVQHISGFKGSTQPACSGPHPTPAPSPHPAPAPSPHPAPAPSPHPAPAPTPRPPAAPAVAVGVHGQSVGALVIDVFNSTIAAKAIRFRCIESAGEPVRLKYFGVHKAPMFDEH